jgi:hypothetical protein
MPDNGPLPDSKKRRELVELLAGLPVPQFKELTFILHPPAGILPGDSAPQRTIAIELLTWAEGTGPGITEFLEVLEQITGKPFLNPISKLGADAYQALFDLFTPRDFGSIHDAFLRAFQDVHEKDFWAIRPDHPSLRDPDQIQTLIQAYEPVLAVRFVEQAIAIWQRDDQLPQRDVTPFKQWLEQTMATFNIAPKPPEPTKPATGQGYLLIALEAHGPSINVFPELHVAGENNPIKFGASPKTCSLAEVPQYLSTWIRAAEQKLLAYGCGQVSLEFFLPCQYLEEIIDAADDWEIQNKQGRPRKLGKTQNFVVRSLDRAVDPTTQEILKLNWQLLEDCLRAKQVCEKFHPQLDCPEIGDLEGLRQVPGLKLIAELPLSDTDRQEIYYDIINAAVPIAFWFGHNNTQTCDERLAELDALLKDCPLTDFAKLAHHWKAKRSQSHLRLLCDRPDRLPRLPDLENRADEDAIVAVA